jgi:hypothetical protein
MPETSVAVSRTSSNKPQTSLVSRVAFGFLGLLLIGIVLVYAVLYFGSVNGEEFSPDSFKRRRFAYWELPLFGIQITPIRHTDNTEDLERYLVAEKLLPKAAQPENRWDLVMASVGKRSLTQGDARILCLYLDAKSKDGDSVWLKWSEDHVEMAKVLWPAIAKVARQELYSFVPDLFVLARSSTAPDQLQQMIDQALADKYYLTAETMAALDQKEIATELFAEVLHHAPDRAEAVRGRDKSLDTNATDLPRQ